MLRGKELDQVIENELQLMLVEGYDKSLFQINLSTIDFEPYRVCRRHFYLS
jgi:hypothetical protein